MTVTINTETVMDKGGEAVTDDVRNRLRQRLTTMLDEVGVKGDERKDALADLEKMLDSAPNLDKLSAESIASALDKADDSFTALDNGIVALGFSLSMRGKTKQAFEMGESRGLLIGARGMLSLAARNLRRAVNCDCTKDDTEAETIPPPPAPEPAA